MSQIQRREPVGVAQRGLREPSGHSPRMLASLIEGEIIPRLLLAHRNAVEDCPDQPAFKPSVDPEEADTFANLALQCDAHQLVSHVETFLLRGLQVEEILVDLISPAAHALGVQWENDSIDFIAVTMGLWRLQEVVYELAARSPGAVRNSGGDRRALFCVTPGDMHSLGTTIVDECFRRSGWNTLCLPSTSESELLALVHERWFEIIGLTVSCDHHTDTLKRLISSLRSASRNPQVGIMVGGPLFVQNPDLAHQVGADATAKDAHVAVARAEELIAGSVYTYATTS
jgi:MerR family transcriptional regulator, light-induced transcriptional regulator